MKVRLVGMHEETRYKLGEVRLGMSEPEQRPVESIEEKFVVARLEYPHGDIHHSISVPVEMVRGAEIGDEFTLHLERVKK